MAQDGQAWLVTCGIVWPSAGDVRLYPPAAEGRVRPMRGAISSKKPPLDLATQ